MDGYTLPFPTLYYITYITIIPTLPFSYINWHHACRGQYTVLTSRTPTATFRWIEWEGRRWYWPFRSGGLVGSISERRIMYGAISATSQAGTIKFPAAKNRRQRSMRAGRLPQSSDPADRAVSGATAAAANFSKSLVKAALIASYRALYRWSIDQHDVDIKPACFRTHFPYQNASQIWEIHTLLRMR